MNEFNPGRILTAIECRGWTRRELAVRYATDPSNISGIINGRLPFTEQVAERMTLATGFPLSFFMLDDSIIDVNQLTFRRKARVSRTLINQMVAEFSLLAGSVKRLASMTSTAPKCGWLDGLSPKTAPSIESIETLAAEVRTFWGIPPTGPIRNMVKNVEHSGIMAVPLTSPVKDPSGDGITFPSYDGIQQIIGYFPMDKTGDRLRFTMAHELGHLVLHRNRIPSDNATAEHEANTFAGALLIPASDAKSAITPTMSLNDYAYIKAGWGVSIAALITRAARLGIIDRQRERSLRIQLSNRGWNRKEPVEVPIEHPLLLKQLVGATFGPMEDYLHPTVSVRSVEGFLGLPFDMVNHWCDDGLTPIQDDFQLP